MAGSMTHRRSKHGAPIGSIGDIMEKALVAVGKDAEFRRDWENFVMRGTSFGGIFSGDEVVEATRVYGIWKPEVLKQYKKLAFEAP